MKILPICFNTLVILSVLTIGAAAQSLPMNDLKVSDAAQDATGQVWAISSYSRGALHIWEGDHWRAAHYSVAKKAQPQALERSQSGGVYCLWNFEGSYDYLLTEHKDGAVRALARFSGATVSPQILPDSAGNVWVVGSSHNIYRIRPAEVTAGAVEMADLKPAYSISDEQYRPGEGPYRKKNAVYNSPLRAFEDGRGHIWFWASLLGGTTSQDSLRGVLIFDGTKFAHYPTLKNVPDKPFWLVAPRDERHVWLSAVGDAVYEVDTATLNATPVAEPEPGALRYTRQVLLNGDDWYVIAGEMWRDSRQGDPSARLGTLWRLRGGVWKRLLEGIDKATPSGAAPRRMWLMTEAGLWLSAVGGGWFIPRQGEPVHLDWRNGLPFNDVNRWFKLNDGRLLAVSYDEGSVVVADVAQFLKPPPTRLRVFKTAVPLVPDSRGRIWGVLQPSEAVLSEWDGTDWIKHPLPQDLKPENIWYVAVDSRDRIWCRPTTRQNTVVVFDPAKQAWETFATYRAALEAQRGQPQNFHFLKTGGSPAFRPVSPDGRIGFMDEWRNINYFDGRTWRKWGLEEVKPKAFVVEGPPFFNSGGNLSVNIEHRTLEWTEAGGWHIASYERGFPYEFVPHSNIPLPQGCTMHPPTSTIRDNQGAIWLTANRQLYKSLLDFCAPAFSPAEHHPFIDQRRVFEAFIDNKGNTFLGTIGGQQGNQEYVIIPAAANLPDTRLQLTKNAEDSVTLNLAVTATGETWFTWRLNGGPWSTVFKEPRVRLDFLPAGEARIEAAAIDRRLQIDPTPATATFTVNIDPAQQISRLIAALSDKDNARREAAVTALARQPARALPALRAARIKADNDLRWWIDASLQAIAESSPTAEKGVN